MNTQTQQMIRFLTGTGKGLVSIAQAKLENKSLAVGNMKNRDMAFRLALSSTIAQNALHLSFSTLDKVNWQEVGASL